MDISEIRAENVNNRNDNSGWTLLHKACVYGSVEVIRLLIALGAYLDVIDQDGSSPLWYACRAGHAECVQELIQSGADVRKLRGTKETVLHSCVVRDKVDCAKLIIDSWPESVFMVDRSGFTALRDAVYFQSVKCVRLLLQCGSLVNQMDHKKLTSLDHCFLKFVNCNNYVNVKDIARLLIEHGARHCDNNKSALTMTWVSWSASYRGRREAKRTRCLVLLQLKRRESRILGRGNGRDVLRLVSFHLFSTHHDFVEN